MISEVIIVKLTASFFLPNEVTGFIDQVGTVFIIGAYFVEILESPFPN